MLFSYHMASLEEKRHTLAHVLAAAVLERYPHARPTIGPAIDNGFYYDFDFSEGPAPKEADLEILQASMEEMLPSWGSMTGNEISPEDARARFAENPFKLELIEGIVSAKDPITLYTAGGFTDLCRGGHAESPAHDIKIGTFVLERIAGAYWRGDEKNPMLTRIYGLAFDTKEALVAYQAQQEEAKKRDHRKLGKELDLFTFSDLVGPGMPLFTPRGATVRNEIVGYSRELNNKLGFGEVHTPNVNKAELFKTSGHYDQYKEDMLSVRSQYVADEMFLKPMNCPQHTQIFASKPRSYRDLPIRYSDFAVLYRDERPGELSGLTRLRAFSQDDGHIFCREDQIEKEVSNVLAAIQEALGTYRISYWMRLSLRDPENKEKYLGEDATWDRAEDVMRDLLTTQNIEFKEALGEAAFYGPKIDIMAVDALGREWQISTIQLDFVQPTRFGLEYTAEDGTKKTPVMIHRALVGSPDRFLGILIEHYAGAFPTWLSPIQARILPVSEKQKEYATTVFQKMQSTGIRVEIDDANESLGKRIRSAKQEKVPYLLVVGDKEIESNTLSVESRDRGPEGAIAVSEFVERVLEEIRTRA
ncbi:threonine--tRNA ligase [Patescibacteria group bacterium]|nr:threonine--tRNA ligase [Patescibacteria group bacterium]MBU1501074.1 threonine--tRNA ligase [Patescibacteria group bacterium]MBU2081053.1 threonine--tRNA ligase [Patescibacteria group bacterium]MBU2124144.1 threonine--tRNA ligase [Patescibacteria group bacterium]MBU2195000.1 threonine--tRNA ligase [Patescibacteria group bacterium]